MQFKEKSQGKELEAFKNFWLFGQFLSSGEMELIVYIFE